MSDEYREFLAFGDCPGDWGAVDTNLTGTDGYQIRTGATWALKHNGDNEFLAVAYRQNQMDSDRYRFVVLWMDTTLSQNVNILHSEQHDMADLESEYGTRADAVEEVVTWVSGEAYDIMKEFPSGYHGGQPPLAAFTE